MDVDVAVPDADVEVDVDVAVPVDVDVARDLSWWTSTTWMTCNTGSWVWPMTKVMAGFFPEFTLSKMQVLSAISARSSRVQFPP